MQLIIVSGLSGAGKTTALHSLEDVGIYCVDNLPVGLLPAFAEQARNVQDCIAVGVDVRTSALHDMPALLQTLDNTAITYKILFLEADDAVLIKRFSETRRKHPLTNNRIALTEAIARERVLLEPLRTSAEVCLNTSQASVHELRDWVRFHAAAPQDEMTLLLQSFGYKYGVPPTSDMVFDMRCLPNPHWHSQLRRFSGKEDAVIRFLAEQPQVQEMLDSIVIYLQRWLPEFKADNRSYFTISIGCTGGRHRSVYMVEQLAQRFSDAYPAILVRHRDLS